MSHKIPMAMNKYPEVHLKAFWHPSSFQASGSPHQK
jgi:hypothetical protein